MSGEMHEPQPIAVRLVRLRRDRLGLSQIAFAKQYGFTIGALRDLEQGRVHPSRATRLWVTTIEADPITAKSIAATEMEIVAESAIFLAPSLDPEARSRVEPPPTIAAASKTTLDELWERYGRPAPLQPEAKNFRSTTCAPARAKGTI
jgi:transcriptional regulator with XRE-family HTH domain